MTKVKIPRSYSLPADIDQKLDDIAVKTGSSRNKVLTRILEKYFNLPTLDAELDAVLQPTVAPKAVATQTSFKPNVVEEQTKTQPLLVERTDLGAIMAGEEFEFDDSEGEVVGVTEVPPMGVNGRREVTGLFGKKK